MSEQTNQVTPDTSNDAPINETQAPIQEAPPSGLSDTPSQSSLSFIPEAYRQSDWATKYKTEDEFYKGIDNMAKLVGKKQIVQGIQAPGENASEDEISAFYAAIGRPEAADKYSLPDVEAFEGFDLASEKAAFSEKAFKAGLTQKQSEALFKEYASLEVSKFKASQEKVAIDFDKAVIEAFGADYKPSLELAKRAAKAYGIADKLDAKGLSKDPDILQFLAKVGENVGEDSFINGSQGSNETLKDEIMRVQKSPEYMRGDKEAHRIVAEGYKKLYPN